MVQKSSSSHDFPQPQVVKRCVNIWFGSQEVSCAELVVMVVILFFFHDVKSTGNWESILNIYDGYIYIISIYKSAYMSFLGGPPAQTQGFWEHCEIRGPGNLEPWFERTSFYHSLGAWSNFSSRCSSVISVVKSRTEIAFGYVGFNMWLAQ